MRLSKVLGAPALIAFLCLAVPAGLAQNQVVNGGFETQHWENWTLTGNLPSFERFVGYFDVQGGGNDGWCYVQIPYTGFHGGLSQSVYLEAGVTYEIKAYFAYEVC